jgi:hypothetical protein
MGKTKRHIVISDMTGPGHLFVIEEDDHEHLAEAMIAIVSALKDGEHRSIRIVAVPSIRKVTT